MFEPVNPNTPFRTIDLFCGAGGLSLGFNWAGFHTVWANEINPYACETFQQAFGLRPDQSPIESIDPNEIASSVLANGEELDCIIGGPPCQAYSVYNHQRSMNDDRSQLFRQYLRFVDALQPRFVVLENVRGILDLDGGAAVEGIYEGLAQIGYNVAHQVLRAEEYGVPQERRRVIFIGSRDGVDVAGLFPDPQGLPPDGAVPNVGETLAGLPVLANGEGDDEAAYDNVMGQSWYSEQLSMHNNGALYNHVAPRLGSINLERMRHIPVGGNWTDIPLELLPAGMRRAHRSDHTKRYGRLDPEGFACTILTKCDLHWGAYIHPYQDRTITVREAARFQGFPDWFRFFGPRTEQYVQVGNAVPPPLAFRIAERIAEALMNHYPAEQQQGAAIAA